MYPRTFNDGIDSVIKEVYSTTERRGVKMIDQKKRKYFPILLHQKYVNICWQCLFNGITQIYAKLDCKLTRNACTHVHH